MSDLLAQPKEALFQLEVSKRFIIKVGNGFEADDERAQEHGTKPKDFRRLVGTYAEVAAEATRRNNFQLQAGFLDWLYHPEPYVAQASKEQAA